MWSYWLYLSLKLKFLLKILLKFWHKGSSTVPLFCFLKFKAVDSVAAILSTNGIFCMLVQSSCFIVCKSFLSKIDNGLLHTFFRDQIFFSRDFSMAGLINKTFIIGFWFWNIYQQLLQLLYAFFVLRCSLQ